MPAEYAQLLDPMTREVSGTVKRTADGAFIPDDGANIDRQAFVAWCEAGNQPDAPEPLPEAAPETDRLAALEARVEALERRISR